jgi:hypothetical protein
VKTWFQFFAFKCSFYRYTEVVSEAPKHLDGVEVRASKHAVDTSFVEIRGKKFKLMPDPTPGRALVELYKLNIVYPSLKAPGFNP